MLVLLALGLGIRVIKVLFFKNNFSDFENFEISFGLELSYG
jgi:hypothetical protein